jgi:cysteine desulfuration protein SufE
VWLLPGLREGRCWFEVDSESQMVRGLAALLVDCFNGATASEVVSFQCSLLEAAGLARRVTPTRLHGLAQVEAAVKSFARSNL